MTIERAKPWLIGLAILVVVAIGVLVAVAWINMLSDLHDLGVAAKHGKMD
jgi:hypothetical protein